MRSFAERVGSEETMAFSNAVLSSDQLGSPLAGILRSQAADFRHRRQMHAEERAQKAPVKMLFPMVLFILPVMFIVILAPAFLGGGIFWTPGSAGASEEGPSRPVSSSLR